MSGTSDLSNYKMSADEQEIADIVKSQINVLWVSKSCTRDDVSNLCAEMEEKMHRPIQFHIRSLGDFSGGLHVYVKFLD